MTEVRTEAPGQGSAGQVSAVDFVALKSGQAIGRYSNKRDVTNRDLVLTNLDGTWGMMLWNYDGYYGVKDEGIGVVAQPWVMQMQPGRFSWVVTDSDWF